MILLKNQQALIKELNEKSTTSDIIVVYGTSGIGMSKACEHFQYTNYSSEHTYFPGCVQIAPPAASTATTLLATICWEFSERMRGKDTISRARYTGDVLNRNHAQALAIDSGGTFDSACLSALWQLKTQFNKPLFLIGYDNLRKKIEKINRPYSYSVTEIQMLEPDLDDALNLLRFLKLPGWRFNPVHTDMYEQLWLQTKPSIRKLLNVLSSATTIANINQTPITRSTYEEALTFLN